MRTERITIRLTPSLRKQLETAAKKETRPLSNYVEKLLLEAVSSERSNAQKRVSREP